MRLLDQAIGITLLHSLWEGAVIALALAVVLGLVRSSRVRYAAGLVAMLALLAGFGVTFYRLMPRHRGGPAVVRTLPTAVSSSSGDGPAASIRTWDAAELLPWLAPLWIAGVLLFQLRCLASWMAAARLRRVGVCGAPVEWFERLDALRARLRMTKTVVLLESCFAEVPVVIGHLRPVILVPVGLLAGLPIGQVEAILLHELAHIRRGDYLVNLMQTVVEGLLFYHPAVWWISATIRGERENCCDDLVVATSGDAHEYATALTALAENRWTMREPVLAATGGNLVKRVRRLLAAPEGPRTAIVPVVSAGILIVTCGIALAAWQSPQQSAPAIAPIPAQNHGTLSEEDVRKLLVPKFYIGDPVAPAPPIKKAVRAQAAAPVASPKPAAKPQPTEWGPQAEALEQLHELMQKIEAKSSVFRRFSTVLAQNHGPLFQTDHRKWLLDEAPYIITPQERAAFLRLRTDEERNIFIEQFWKQRDPTPDTVENEFREEHYRRMAFANDRFGTKTAEGWTTDRGRIYIVYGPPDEIDAHPNGGTYTRPPERGGGLANTFPFEEWRYRHIEGVGENVVMGFVDPGRNGDYRLILNPKEKEQVLEYFPKRQNAAFFSAGPGEKAKVVVEADRQLQVTLPIDYDATKYSIKVASSQGKTVSFMGGALADPCEEKPGDSGCRSNYRRTFSFWPQLPPGVYVMTAVTQHSGNGPEKSYVVKFSAN